MSVLSEALNMVSLPQGWDVRPLVAVAKERRGNKNSGMRENNLLSLSYGRIIRKDIDTTEGLLPESFEGYQIVEPGDLVMRLTDLQNDKRSLRSGLCMERGIITSAYLALNPVYIEPRYFSYLMRAFDTAKVLYPLGGGMRQSLKFEDIRALPVPVPPVEDQRRIADFLDDQVTRIDQAMSFREKQLQLVEGKLTAATASILSGGTSERESFGATTDEWITELPDNWTMQPLKHLVTSNNSGAWGEEEGLLTVDSPVATTAQISIDGSFAVDAMPIRSFTFADYERYSCEPNDILVVKSSGSATNVISGKCGLVREDTPTFVFSNFLLRLHAMSVLEAEWILEFLQSQFTRERVKRMVSVTTYPNLRTDEYLNALIPVPPSHEMELQVSELRAIREGMLHVRLDLTTSIKLLEERKRALITSAVTGRIDVTNARPIMSAHASTVRVGAERRYEQRDG